MSTSASGSGAFLHHEPWGHDRGTGAFWGSLPEPLRHLWQTLWAPSCVPGVQAVRRSGRHASRPKAGHLKERIGIWKEHARWQKDNHRDRFHALGPEAVAQQVAWHAGGFGELVVCAGGGRSRFGFAYGTTEAWWRPSLLSTDQAPAEQGVDRCRPIQIHGAWAAGSWTGTARVRCVSMLVLWRMWSGSVSVEKLPDHILPCRQKKKGNHDSMQQQWDAHASFIKANGWKLQGLCEVRGRQVFCGCCPDREISQGIEARRPKTSNSLCSTNGVCENLNWPKRKIWWLVTILCNDDVRNILVQESIRTLKGTFPSLLHTWRRGAEWFGWWLWKPPRRNRWRWPASGRKLWRKVWTWNWSPQVTRPGISQELFPFHACCLLNQFPFFCKFANASDMGLCVSTCLSTPLAMLSGTNGCRQAEGPSCGRWKGLP